MDQKVALVTGASSGIGTAAALRLATEGYAVMAAGRDAERTERLREEAPDLRTWVGDLTSAPSCNDLVSACVEAFGRLDVLVNNAGIYYTADAEQTTDEIWSQTIAVNLNAPFFMSRAVVPHLRRSRGVIVNVASDFGLVGGEQAVAYCASKGGLVLMSKAMAVDYAAEGIRVNAICPGDVETPMLYEDGARQGFDRATALRDADAASPTGRVTTAEEVAALIAFLASEVAVQINGAAISIDGGNTAR